MLNKKSQSAMEYLMTYGWAVLIILVALGSLYYLGVFTPSTPSTCQIQAPFVCMDVRGIGGDSDYAAGSVFEVRIGAGDVTNPSVTNIEINGADCNVEGALSTNQPTSIYCYTTDLTLSEGDKYTGIIYLEYTSQYGGIVHNIEGQMSGSIEKCGSDDDCYDFLTIGDGTCDDGICVY